MSFKVIFCVYVVHQTKFSEAAANLLSLHFPVIIMNNEYSNKYVSIL